MNRELPPSLSRYGHDLENAIQRRVAERPRRQRQVTITAGCAAVAAAGVGVAAVGLSASGGPISPPVADAAIIRHVERAVTPGPNTIIHAELNETQPGPTGSHADTQDIWILPVRRGAPCNRSECPARDLRIVFQAADSSQQIDTSTNGRGATDIYDSDSGTVYDTNNPVTSFEPPEPVDALNDSGVDPLLPGFASKLQHLIKTGRAHVVGDTTVGSRKVIEIAGRFVACGPTADEPPTLPSVPTTKPGERCVQVSKWTYDVDPNTYDPVQMQSTSGGLTNTISYTTYQALPAAGNMDVFNLTAQHPGARIDSNPADYAAEVGRICGAEGASPNISTCTAVPDPDAGAATATYPQPNHAR